MTEILTGNPVRFDGKYCAPDCYTLINRRRQYDCERNDYVELESEGGKLLRCPKCIEEFGEGNAD